MKVPVYEEIDSDELTYRANQRLLTEVSHALLGLEQISDTMEQLGEKVGRHFAVKYCTFAEHTDEFETAIVPYAWNASDVPSLKGTYRMRDFLTEAALTAVRAGEPLVVNNTQTDRRVNAANYAALNIHSFILMPLVRNDEWRFQLSIIDCEPRYWRPDEVELMSELTTRIWTRLERACAEESLRSSEAWLAAQKEAFQTAIRGAPLETSLEILVRTAVEQSKGELQCAFYIANETGTELHHVVGMPDTYAKSVDGFRIGPDSFSCGLAVHTGRPVVTPDVYLEPRWSCMRWLAEQHDFRGCWSFPVETEEKVVGTFAMYFKSPRDATPADFDSAAILTRAAAIIISGSQKAEARARAEKALLRNEQMFSALINNAPFGVYMVDSQMRLLSVNAGARDVFRNAELLIGRDLLEILRVASREPLVSEVITRFRHTIDTGESFISAPVILQGANLDEIEAYDWQVHRVTLPDGSYGAVCYFYDLSEQKRLEESVRRAHNELEERVRERTSELSELNGALLAEVNERSLAQARARDLVGQLVTAQEDERARVARDLHDHLGQQLTALRLNLDRLAERSGASAELRELARQSQETARLIDANVDFLARQLRPSALDDLGLVVALNNYLREWSNHFEIPAVFHSSGLERSRVSPELEVNIYRMAQEALNNVAKHANASQVDVILERREHHVVLIVEDDGVGFDLEILSERSPKGLGLVGLRERAALVGGTADIQSTPGSGTTIFLRVPLEIEEGGAASA